MMKWVRRALGMGQEIERQRLLFVTHRELPEDVFALVRITHFGTYGLTGVIPVCNHHIHVGGSQLLGRELARTRDRSHGAAVLLGRRHGLSAKLRGTKDLEARQ